MLNNILEKNYNYEDNHWFKDFLSVKKSLVGIKSNVSPNYVYGKKNMQHKNENLNGLDSFSNISLSSVSSCSSYNDINLRSGRDSVAPDNKNRLFMVDKPSLSRTKTRVRTKMNDFWIVNKYRAE